MSASFSLHSAQIGLKPLENHELLVNYQKFSATDVGIPGGAAFPAAATATYKTAEREMISTEYRVKNALPKGLNINDYAVITLTESGQIALTHDQPAPIAKKL